MPDVEALNTVAAADIEAVNGVAKANIQAINGVGIPAGGASLWAISVEGDDGYISWAATADIADVTVWEGNLYQNAASNTADGFEMAYGLDGSGGAMWMQVSNTSSKEIQFDGNNDITDESTWSVHNIHADYGNAKCETIHYSNGDGNSDSSSGNAVTRVGCWIATGRTSSGNVWTHRSVDGGANWTHLNLNGLTNIAGNSNSDYHIRALAGDGTGNWLLAQRGNLYFSSDSGVSFAFLCQPSGNGADKIIDIVYTNATWCVLLNDGGTAMLYVCAGSTLTNMDDATNDWGSTKMQDDPSDNSPANTEKLTGNSLQQMAGAGGRIVAVDTARSLAATVNGKTTPTIQGTTQTLPDEGSLRCIATDGTIWLAGSEGSSTGPDGGDICRSLDGGESWTRIVEGIHSGGDKEVHSIAANVVLPI